MESDHWMATAAAARVVESPGLREPVCDLCGCGQWRHLHSWPVGDAWNPATIELSVWQCSRCNLVCLHPVPQPHELPDEGDWWSGRRRRPRRLRQFKRIREAIRRALFGTGVSRLVRATHRLKPSGRFLDVGCGRGRLLAAAQQYYDDAVGLEPSPIAAAEARQRGFQVIESTFEAADLPPDSFDVVALDAVIEHVASPIAVLSKINWILRPGGVVVMRTPKFGGPAYRIHGRAWNGFRHGYHTFLFDGKTLGALLEKTGFRVPRHPRRDRPLDDILILWGQKIRPADLQPYVKPGHAV